MREFNLPRVPSSSATIPFETFLSRRLVPRLHQLLLLQPINRPQNFDVALAFHNVSSLLAPFAPTHLSIQSRIFPYSACSFSYLSTVAPRPKLLSNSSSCGPELSSFSNSLGRITTRRRPLLRVSIAINARYSNRTGVATRTSINSNKMLATGSLVPRGRLFTRCPTTLKQAPRLTAPESSSTMKSSA